MYWHRGRCLSYGEGVTYWALADMVRDARADRRGRGARPRRSPSWRRSSRSTSPIRRSAASSSRGSRTCSGSRTSARGTSAKTCSPPGGSSSSGSPTSTRRVMLFEDMQWADASLLDFIEYLLEWGRNSPALRRHAGATRAARTAANLGRRPPELHFDLPGAALRSTRWRSCSPASSQACPEELRAQILARAEGIPLYAVETVRMLLDRGALVQEGAVYRPTGDDRVARGPGDAPRTDRRPARRTRRRPSAASLQDASVLGKTFTKQSLAALSGLARGGSRTAPAPRSSARRSSVSRSTRARPSTASTASCRTCSARWPTRRSAKADRKARHLAAAAYLERTTRRAGGRRGRCLALPRCLRVAPDAADAAEIQCNGRRAACRCRRAGGLPRSERGGRALLRPGSRAHRRPTRRGGAGRAGGADRVAAGFGRSRPGCTSAGRWPPSRRLVWATAARVSAPWPRSTTAKDIPPRR